MWGIVCSNDQTLLAKVRGNKGDIPQLEDYKFINGVVSYINGKYILQCPSLQHVGKGKPIWKSI